jgi:ribbon-helix-helix protein
MKKDEALKILETYLTDEQLFRLKRVSDMTGAPISTLIRIAVADYLKSLPKSLTQRRNLPEQAP